MTSFSWCAPVRVSSAVEFSVLVTLIEFPMPQPRSRPWRKFQSFINICVRVEEWSGNQSSPSVRCILFTSGISGYSLKQGTCWWMKAALRIDTFGFLLLLQFRPASGNYNLDNGHLHLYSHEVNLVFLKSQLKRKPQQFQILHNIQSIWICFLIVFKKLPRHFSFSSRQRDSLVGLNNSAYAEVTKIAAPYPQST